MIKQQFGEKLYTIVRFVHVEPDMSLCLIKRTSSIQLSGVPKEGYVLDVEPGETYLLRIINAGLFSEFYLKIAGHKFTVVAADANYVSPFTTDVIAIAPGETVDALLVADAPPGKYYMVALPNQAPLPDTQTPEYATRGMVRYKVSHSVLGSSWGADEQEQGGYPSGDAPIAPDMPDIHDTITSFYFHGNLTSLHHHRRHHPVPQQVDERLFIVLSLGTICKQGYPSCKRGDSNENILVATMNNASFLHPTWIPAPLLEAHYYHTSLVNRTTQELPKRPPKFFNFTDETLIPFGPKEMRLEPTYKAALARRFRHGAVVEMVFQSTAVLQGDSNPMHLHGHDMLVLAQGLGNYDPVRDVARYNLVNPPVKNTVLAPNRGWIAVRFVANNPGT
jgi:laccase